MTSNSQPCGTFSNGHHIQTYRIYYEDTDAGGIVYYANYLKFAERARTDALRCMGIIQSDLAQNEGLFFVVTRCDIRFQRPAKLDDIIEVETELLSLRKVRMTMRQIIKRDQAIFATLDVDIAMLNSDSRPASIPVAISECLMNHLMPTAKGE